MLTLREVEVIVVKLIECLEEQKTNHMKRVMTMLDFIHKRKAISGCKQIRKKKEQESYLPNPGFMSLNKKNNRNIIPQLYLQVTIFLPKIHLHALHCFKSHANRTYFNSCSKPQINKSLLTYTDLI